MSRTAREVLESGMSSLEVDDLLNWLDREGLVIVPKLSPEAMLAEHQQRAREIETNADETRRRIREGARPSKGRFRL